jgi:integrase
MDKLQWDLRQLCKRNRDGSFSTQAARERILDLAARELAALGYVDMRAQSLKPKHVEALVGHWQGKGLSVSTVKNRLAGLRWWAEKVGKPSVVPADNERLGVPDRVYASSTGKQLALDADKLVAIEDERVKLSLLLQAEFGLRREESIKFQPGYAIRGDTLHLKPAWTKGGRAREIPVRTENQRWVLEQVKSLAGKGSLIPPDLTYVRQLKIYEAALQKAGISRAHGLRHAYAQRRYEELAGWKSPTRAGRRRRD